MDTLKDIVNDIVSSSKFLNWLQSQNITLAISTYQTNSLFLIGTHNDGKPAFVSRDFFHPMGLAVNHNNLWISTKTQILRLENVLNPELHIENCDRFYVPRASYITGDLDTHDLTVVDEGVVFVNSKYSCLATLHPHHSFQPLWKPKFISKLAPEDRCHLNGLALVNGKPKYVTAISRSDVTDGWRDNRQQGGVVIDLETDEIISERLSMPHSPRYYRGKLWLLNSGTGDFGYLDIDTGKFEAIAFVPGYARGLAFWDNFAVIGLSKPRDKTFNGLALDKTLELKQAEPRCGVVVIDLNTGNIVHWVWIQDRVRELYDIQIIPEVSKASILEEKDLEDFITFPTQFTPPQQQQTKLDLTPEFKDKLVVAQKSFKEAKQLEKAEKIAEAMNCYQQAIQNYPDYAAAYHGLGLLFWQEEEYKQAQECFERVISLDQNSASAYLNLGNIFKQQQQPEKAIAAYEKSIDLQPQSASAWHNLGLTYTQSYELDRAESNFAKAIQADKQHLTSYYELARIWDFKGKISDSKKLYEQALKRNPQADLQVKLTDNLELAKIKLGDWQNYYAFQKQLNDRLHHCLKEEADFDSFTVFELINLEIDNQIFLETAKKQSNKISQAIKKIDFKYRDQSGKDKIRIGYVSPDFRSHAVGRLIYGLFQYHDRDKFEVYGYSLLNFEDEYTQKIKQGCDVFRQLQDLSDGEAAEQINRDGIDILVDLAGYTFGNKAGIFALQPAPIQVSYLGYPSTMGADFIQYILADRWLIPEDCQINYSEKVIYLPQGFIGSEIEIAQSEITKSELGLPEDSFIFSCSNNHKKIDTQVFQTWMEILQAVPNSILWLSNCPEEAINNFKQNAVNYDIAPERLIFSSETFSYNKYLKTLTLADLFLDTFVYNAGATAVASLQAGLPLLTKVGNKYANRMGASVCAAAGLESMICNTVEEYKQKAIALANNPQELQQIKDYLKTQKAHLSLFNVPQFVSSLEAAYLQIAILDNFRE
jgi:protein O-GlcNAc transferase